MDPTAQLVRLLVERPELPAAVRRLDPSQVLALVHRVGLADASVFIGILDPAQFNALADDMLWRDDAEGDFADERFVDWLDVVAESGPSALAGRLLGLPEELLVRALFGQIYVFEAAALGIDMASASWEEAELVERVLDASLYLELDSHTLIARRGLGWDTVIEAILEIDAADHSTCQRLLEALAGATRAHLEAEKGWHTVLDEAEELDEVATSEREDRRARRGFVSTQDARAFLALAPSVRDAIGATQSPRDPITKAYFRNLDAPGAQPQAIASGELDAILGALTSAGDQPRPLPLPWDRREQDELSADDIAQLAYLANVLLSSQLATEPYAAAVQVMEVCQRGLERLRLAHPGVDAGALLEASNFDRLFLLGWDGEQK